MGRLVKNQWARLIILTAAMYQILASIQAFVWPKVFWDFSSRILDPLVKPVPTLQITNVVLGLAVLGFEWPIRQITGGAAHRSIPLRVMLYPFCSFAAVLMYQSTNAAIYYLIGTGIYLWALREGEIISPKPWKVPGAQQNRDLESGLVLQLENRAENRASQGTLN